MWGVGFCGGAESKKGWLMGVVRFDLFGGQSLAVRDADISCVISDPQIAGCAILIDGRSFQVDHTLADVYEVLGWKFDEAKR